MFGPFALLPLTAEPFDERRSIGWRFSRGRRLRLRWRCRRLRRALAIRRRLYRRTLPGR
jgi:hypothetical protein